MSIPVPATAIIDDIRRDLHDAATSILSLAFMGLSLVRQPLHDAVALESVFTGLLETASFQDITGQKLDQLTALMTGRVDLRPDSQLLNGPAAGRSGLDQDAIDHLFTCATE